MAQTRTRRHARVDDMPVMLGVAHQRRLTEILDRHLGTPSWPVGLNHGPLPVGWLADILSQADHRQAAVRAWANDMPHPLGGLLGQPSRAVEVSDDRRGGVRRRLSDDEAWEAIEHDLGAATVAVYAVELPGGRLDSPTRSGSHQVPEAGVRPVGPRTDHRPDLPHLKGRVAAAAPLGQRVACDVEPGPRAADPLDTPRIQRVRRLVGRPGVRDAGDGTMAARATRAELAAPQDDDRTPWPLTGETARPFERWGDTLVDGMPEATRRWDGERRLGVGYACERPLRATGDGPAVHGTERGQVGRSLARARRPQATLETPGAAAAGERQALTPAPGRGQRQRRDEATWHAALARGGARHHVTGRVTVTWARPETPATREGGRTVPPARRWRCALA